MPWNAKVCKKDAGDEERSERIGWLAFVCVCIDCHVHRVLLARYCYCIARLAQAPSRNTPRLPRHHLPVQPQKASQAARRARAKAKAAAATGWVALDELDPTARARAAAATRWTPGSRATISLLLLEEEGRNSSDLPTLPAEAKAWIPFALEHNFGVWLYMAVYVVR